MQKLSHALAGAIMTFMIGGCGGAVLEPVQMEDRPLEKPLSINTRPRVLAIGNGFSVGIKQDGTVWTWGGNHKGILARPVGKTGAGIDDPFPGKVPSIKGAVSVAASSSHVLVLMKDGTVWTWGENNHRQLGYDTKHLYSSVPQQVPGLTNVVDIAAQTGVSQVLKKDGSVWGFGWGVSGGLGSKAEEDRNPLLRIDGLAGIVRIEIGSGVSLAIDAKGKLWTYGEDRHWLGRPLGGSAKAVAAAPGAVGLPRPVVEVSANSHAVYALLDDGTVWSWGYNNGGQLGTGEQGEKGRPLPARIPSLSGIVALASSSGGSVVAQDGTVATWGVSAASPPPPGPLPRHDLAVPHKLLFKAKMPLRQLVGGYAVVDADGKVFYWKANHRGQRGTGEKVVAPSSKYWITPEQSLWSHN